MATCLVHDAGVLPQMGAGRQTGILAHTLAYLGPVVRMYMHSLRADGGKQGESAGFRFWFWGRVASLGAVDGTL
jgi:hypothetical protein